AGDKTSADAKKSAQDTNDKADNHEIDRVDVNVRDREKHDLPPAAAQEAKQQCRHRIQGNSLPGDEQDCDYRIRVAMPRLQVVQPFAQKVKNQEKVAGDQNRINRQFNGKSSKSFRSFFFHAASIGRITRSLSPPG